MLIETAAGLFHTKLRGAAQAPNSLVAEILVGGPGGHARAPGVARVLIDVPSGLFTDDRNDELEQLLRASSGANLGFHPLRTSAHSGPIHGMDSRSGRSRRIS